MQKSLHVPMFSFHSEELVNFNFSCISVCWLSLSFSRDASTDQHISYWVSLFSWDSWAPDLRANQKLGHCLSMWIVGIGDKNVAQLLNRLGHLIIATRKTHSLAHTYTAELNISTVYLTHKHKNTNVRFSLTFMWCHNASLHIVQLTAASGHCAPACSVQA